MRNKILLWLCVLTTMLCMNGCGKKEAKETTMTGMVVSVDGTKVTIVQMDMEGQERPEGGEFNPEDFEGEMPQMPNFEEGEMPQMPNFEEGEMPQMPNFEEGEMPQMPNFEEGEMPERPDGEEMPDFSDRFSDAETTEVDLKDAHITIEESDGMKAAGSMDDIKQGTFLTITMDGDGKVTEVLISATQGFGQGMPGMQRKEKEKEEV